MTNFKANTQESVQEAVFVQPEGDEWLVHRRTALAEGSPL